MGDVSVTRHGSGLSEVREREDFVTVPHTHGSDVDASDGRDFDLSGIVGIRLVDATSADVAKIRRQLGPLQAKLIREPDITIRFVDRVVDEPLTYVGVGDAGFTDDGFFVLRGKGGTLATALIPFADIGNQPEIICERTMPAVPHLLTLINLTALTKGVLPLHACAFDIDSTGVLVTGWAKSGKTESLLACMSEGADYVGDEWVYLTPEREMFGLPEPIRLWAWHLDQLPSLLADRGRGVRTRLSTWRRLAALARGVSHLPASGVARKALPILERQAYIQVPPADLFGEDRIRLHGTLSAVVLMMSHSSPDITVVPAGPKEISGRMLSSLADERAAFLAHYRQFRYAFPMLSSPVVEQAQHMEAELLSVLFDEVPATKVSHPYPCDIGALGRAVKSAAFSVPAVRGGESE